MSDQNEEYNPDKAVNRKQPKVVEDDLTPEQRFAMGRVAAILHPQREGLADYTIKGAKYGFIAGATVGLVVPFLFKNTERVPTMIKSVLNMTFIGTTYMASSYVLERRMFLPGLSNALGAGALSCGLTSGLLGGRSQILPGALGGSLVAGMIHIGYRVTVATTKKSGEVSQQNKDTAELTALIERHKLELSPPDYSLYERLLAESKVPVPTFSDYITPFKATSKEDTMSQQKRNIEVISQQQKQIGANSVLGRLDSPPEAGAKG
eukprot:gene11636-13586_t